jgi:hypothetical protein
VIETILIALASGLAGATIVALVNAYYQRKNLEFNTLTRIFDLLADKDHRDARKVVFKAFEEYVKGDKPNLIIFEKIEEDVEIVRSDYDQIGILIYKHIDKAGKYTLNLNKRGSGYVPKEVFFEAWAGSVVNSWFALEHFIEYQRGEKFSEKRFMLFFQHLASEALEFHKSKGSSKIQKLKEENKEKLELWLKQIKDKKQIDT